MASNLSPGGGPSIAVLIPCYNEELTIGEVVRCFRAQLPHVSKTTLCERRSEVRKVPNELPLE